MEKCKEELIKTVTSLETKMKLLESNYYFYAFHKHANSEVQKPTDDCVFCCRQSP